MDYKPIREGVQDVIDAVGFAIPIIAITVAIIAASAVVAWVIESI